jgi:hypothetical protein
MDRDLERCIELWLEARREMRECAEMLGKLMHAHPKLPAVQMRIQAVRSMMGEVSELLTVLGMRLR